MNTIRPDTRIGDLLKQHPQLLDVLADYAPAFARLRHPLLRRTVGRMATLAQAASLGSVDLAALLRTLRQAVGEPEPPPDELPIGAARLPLSAASPEPPAWLDESQIAARFDARPLHAGGKNPLAPILKAAGDVREGHIFYLHNTFEPLPLYELLAGQGFTPWARQTATDDWEVFFYRLRSGEASPLPATTAAENDAPPVASVTIDVTQLTPPEPMMRVLEALSRLAPGQTLLVRHVQRPMYLYNKLDEMGHTHQTWEIGPRNVQILIKVRRESEERE
ncbi:MAG: DUF2249 domain-containing protein [Anaerolineae bacterium]|nr:MAG: DUF2249 domain-containing protein [Anaerolineae bacterium]